MAQHVCLFFLTVFIHYVKNPNYELEQMFFSCKSEKVQQLLKPDLSYKTAPNNIILLILDDNTASDSKVRQLFSFLLQTDNMVEMGRSLQILHV